MDIEGDHAPAPSNAPDDIAETINADAVETNFLHLLFDDGDDIPFPGGKGLGADQVGEEARVGGAAARAVGRVARGGELVGRVEAVQDGDASLAAGDPAALVPVARRCGRRRSRRASR